MSNLTIVNQLGTSYTTEVIRRFVPSECDQTGSMEFKVRSNGHFKKRVPLNVSGSDSGCAYNISIVGGTINGNTTYTKNYPITPLLGQQDRFELAFVDKVELDLEFTNEATITISQELPGTVFAKTGSPKSWNMIPITCTDCGVTPGELITINSFMNFLDNGFTIRAHTCAR